MSERTEWDEGVETAWREAKEVYEPQISNLEATVENLKANLRILEQKETEIKSLKNLICDYEKKYQIYKRGLARIQEDLEEYV